MNFVNYITVILLSLEPSYSDKETWEERTTRMEMIATAIDDASSKATCEEKYNVPGCKKEWTRGKRSLAILLITKGFWESRFAKNVHEGKCRPFECDSYTVNGNRLHRARSPWQIQRTGLVTKEEYSKMNSATVESTTTSANVATRYLVQGMNTCHTIQGTIAIYGGVNSCTWDGAKARTDFYNSLSKRSEAELQSIAATRKTKLEARLAADKK